MIKNIFEAIYYSDIDYVKAYIDSGNELNFLGENCETPLTFLCQRRFFPNIEFIDKLIELGSDINSINDYKESSLMVASKHGHLHIVQKLLSFQPNVFLKNIDGKTALDLSIDYHHPKISHILNTYISYIDLKQNFDYNKDYMLNKKIKI